MASRRGRRMARRAADGPGTLGAGLLGDVDPLVAELQGASFLKVAELAASAQEASAASHLVASVARDPRPEHLALALAVHSVAQGETREAAAAAIDRLTAAGVPMPAWAGALAAPVAPGEFSRTVSPPVSLLTGSFTRAGVTHVIVMTVDEEREGEASVVAALRPEDRAELERQLPPGSTTSPLTAEEFRMAVETALSVRDAHNAEFAGTLDERVEFAAQATVLRSRLALLPEPHDPTPRSESR